MSWRGMGLAFFCCGVVFAVLRGPEWVDLLQLGMLCFILAELTLLRKP